jgi:hypothetical protein
MRNLELNALLDEERKGVSFHDSQITKIQLDYIKREAVFDCLICAEDVDDKDWHKGRLIFGGLLFFNSEIPDETYPFENDSLDISGNCSVFEVAYNWPKFPDDLPEPALIHCFYVNNWNRCLFISATEAHFEWD